MVSKLDLLQEEERRQLEEKLKSVDRDFELPPALLSAQLHQKLSDEDCRNFREAGHPDFMDWQRYAGMVASFIVVLVGLVLFTTGIIPNNKFVANGVAQEAPTMESMDAGEIAAMDMDEAEMFDGVVEESAQADAPAALAKAPQSTRSRLYASGYESITDYLNRGWGDAKGQLLSEQDAADYYEGLQVPDATWQKEFTDVPGESADVLKSDGTYFYYYTGAAAGDRTGKVHIVEAATLSEVATIATGSSDGTELFIRDGRLVVISQNRSDAARVLYSAAVLADSAGQSIAADQLQQQAQQRAELYGITTVSVYDLSNIAQPQLVRSFMQDGLYQTSRLVGGRLCLFTRKEADPQLSRGQNALLCDTLPVVCDSLSGSATTLATEHVAIVPEGGSNSYLTVSAFDVAGDQQVITNSVLGASQSYLSDGSVYFCYEAENDQVGIIRMSMDLYDMNITSQITLDGSLERPFAINRFEDVLRVATVSADPATGTNYTKLYMMDDTFHLVGSVEGIASNEEVTGICFVDDMVYITSQREERPVFVVNLEDPADPVLMGQVELEELPESFRLAEGSLLLGLRGGAEGPLRLTADDVAGRMFATANWNDCLPRTRWEERLPGAFGSSYAQEDHRALLYNSEQQTVGFPVVCRQANGRLLYWGYAVYRFDAEEGLSRRAIITHADQLGENVGQQRRDVVRGRVIGDYLYTFSGSMIKAHDLNTMQETASMKFA